MATSTDVPLYTTTLASAVASVDIDVSGYQNYTNLKLVISNGNTNNPSNVCFKLNDAAGTYSATNLAGGNSGSGVTNRTTSRTDGIYIDYNVTFLTGYNVLMTAYFMNYSNASIYKTVIGQVSSASSAAEIGAGTWQSSAAITKITVTTASANTFSAGTVFSVYGIGTNTSGLKASGGAIYTDDLYNYHVFTSSGAFTPTQALTADVLVVAGGGGGANNIGGGGGAGGVRYGSAKSFASGVAHTCTVGGGGAGAYTAGGTQTLGNKGTDSSISGTGFTTYSATGGGYGANGDNNGGTGGSGGGTRANVGNGGTGNQGAYTPVEGYNGGKGSAGTNSGGGGGAGEVGANGTSGQSGRGGNGTNAYTVWTSVTGLGVNGYFAAGGGGGGYSVTPVLGGSGGLGGGGNGTYTPAGTNGVNAVANTGSGGGGAADVTGAAQSAGAGGSGFIIVRYLKA